jgi:hypothetical protein
MDIGCFRRWQRRQRVVNDAGSVGNGLSTALGSVGHGQPRQHAAQVALAQTFTDRAGRRKPA